MTRSREEEECEERQRAQNAYEEREERIASALECIADVLRTSSTPKAVRVEVVLPGSLRIELGTGAVLEVPLCWFPRLNHASWDERSKHRLIGGGVGIHWPDIDEDLSVSGIIARALGVKHFGD